MCFSLQNLFVLSVFVIFFLSYKLLWFNAVFRFADVLEADNKNKLCSASFPRREVEIKEKEAIRVNFTLTEDEQNSNSGYRQNTFICVFFLKVPENMGIFGVIQKMSFRRDPRTSNCTDYIQVSVPVFMLSCI